MKKILIIGASSKIGEAITKVLLRETEYELVLISSKSEKIVVQKKVETYPFTILNPKEIKSIAYKIKPDYIINCAGVSDVDYSEKNRNIVWDVNVTGVENLLSICRVIEARLITFSSDFIFDGLKGPYTEEAAPNPQNFFGKSKHAAENAVRAGLDNYAIIRTSWVYGISSYGNFDFLSNIVNKEISEKIKFLSDNFYCSPTFTEDIARGVMKIVESNKTGIYNIAGADWLDKTEIWKTIQKVFPSDNFKLDFDLSKIKPTKKFGLVNLKTSMNLGFKTATFENGLIAMRTILNDIEFSKRRI